MSNLIEYRENESNTSDDIRSTSDNARDTNIHETPFGRTISEVSKWNKNQEIAAQKIGESANSLKVMHINVSRNASSKYEMLMIISIILGPASGTINIIGAEYPDHVAIFLIISAIISFVSGILVAIVKFSSLDEVSIAHKSAAAKYTSLESNVRRQLSLYRDNRPAPDKYLEWLTSSYDELFASTPLIPRDIQDSYAEHARKNGITLPDQIENVIEINTKYRQSKLRDVINTSHINIETNSNSNPNSNQDLDIRLEGVDIEANNSHELSASNDVRGIDAQLKGESLVKINRTNSMNYYSDLGQFGDGLMAYEMSRMFGFNST
jgi:hypothetical protein